MVKVLVVAPHPDDSVLGCGGAILRHVARGDKVYLCIITKNYKPEWTTDEIMQKREEAIKASAVLHIKETFFLGFPTVKLDTIPQKRLNDSIFRIVNEVEPEIVYAPHKGDLNKDHGLVFDAVMVATRPMSTGTVRQILSYETLSSTEWASPSAENAFIPNVYMDISEVLKMKLEALSVYKTELRSYPHPRSLEVVSTLAKLRGMTIGVKAAEAFMLIRGIWI